MSIFYLARTKTVDRNGYQQVLSKNLINFVLFQISWLVCVLSGAADNNLPAILMTMFFVLLHFLLTDLPKTDAKLIIAAVLTGIMLDSTYSVTGLMAYNAQTWAHIAPWWILCLWVNFALILNHSLGWLINRPLLTVLFAGIGSPISYYAGHKIGALNWLQPEMLIMVTAITWAIAVPLLMLLAKRWRKQEQDDVYALV
ncbi:DUF2878 domain-containing protein [Methylophaga sp. OBS3]|uniref:DUF2878 domain-containing protein n=1 Tax=Methylophaga sp. OBS3 TaxID=2991934 RepID=UPI0022590A2E|nr:DUF2878 domain-containing protein [Methylophaga sp. OBS3]MCX4189435.1 DUF2878 domain-containing protein [Methylophaga sp. OBS3]